MTCTCILYPNSMILKCTSSNNVNRGQVSQQTDQTWCQTIGNVIWLFWPFPFISTPYYYDFQLSEAQIGEVWWQSLTFKLPCCQGQHVPFPQKTTSFSDKTSGKLSKMIDSCSLPWKRSMPLTAWQLERQNPVTKLLQPVPYSTENRSIQPWTMLTNFWSLENQIECFWVNYFQIGVIVWCIKEKQIRKWCLRVQSHDLKWVNIEAE